MFKRHGSVAVKRGQVQHDQQPVLYFPAFAMARPLEGELGLMN